MQGIEAGRRQTEMKPSKMDESKNRVHSWSSVIGGPWQILEVDSLHLRSLQRLLAVGAMASFHRLDAVDNGIYNQTVSCNDAHRTPKSSLN